MKYKSLSEVRKEVIDTLDWRNIGAVATAASADLMLVLKVQADGTWTQVYFGDFEKVRQAANYSKRDNKNMITIAKLRKLA